MSNAMSLGVITSPGLSLTEHSRQVIGNQLLAFRGTGTVRPTLHHSGRKGAEEEIDWMARQLGYQIEIHPSINAYDNANLFQEGDVLHQPSRPIDQNREIAEACSMLVALPKRSRSGALNPGPVWITVRGAQRKGSRVLVVYSPARA